MSEKGYIKLNRKLFEHRLWCEAREFSTFEAWLDLIKSARFEDATQNIGKYQTQLIKRGQIIASMRFLSERWKWSTKKVTRFLQYLESQHMISKETPKETGITTITLLNYDTYNQAGNTKETPTETPRKHQGDSKETNISNYKELNKENTIPPYIPPIGGKGESVKNWWESFDVYLLEFQQAYKLSVDDQKWMAQREKFHPSLNIKRSLSKAYTDFWGTEAGWKHKKNEHKSEIRNKESPVINWRLTLTNALTQKMNQVYKDRNNE